MLDTRIVEAVELMPRFALQYLGARTRRDCIRCFYLCATELGSPPHVLEDEY